MKTDFSTAHSGTIDDFKVDYRFGSGYGNPFFEQFYASDTTILKIYNAIGAIINPAMPKKERPR